MGAEAEETRIRPVPWSDLQGVMAVEVAVAVAVAVVVTVVVSHQRLDVVGYWRLQATAVFEH